MLRISSFLLAAGAGLALATPNADAGAPTVVANALDAVPSASAGPNGVLHLVWNDSGSHLLTYCQTTTAAPTACTKRSLLPFDSEPGDSAIGQPEAPFVVRDPATGTLYLAMQKYLGTAANPNKTWLWTSTDQGTSWSGPVAVHTEAVGTNPERPILGPQPGRMSFSSGNPSRFVFDAPIDGSLAADASRTNLPDPGVDGLIYNTSLAPVREGTVATADSLENVYAWKADAGITLGVDGAWSPAALVGPGSDSTAHGAGDDAYLGYTTGSGGARRFVIRHWEGDAFGAPVTIEREPGASADLYVSDGGQPGAAYRVDSSLRYTFAADGAHFETKTVVRSDEVFFNLRVAHDDSGAGVAIWTRDGAVVAAPLTEVADPTQPTRSTTITKDGFTTGLNHTGGCVLPGKQTRVTVGGQGKGTVKRVTFRFGAQQKTDTKKAFQADFTVPKGAKPGASIPVKATVAVTVEKKTKSRTIVSSVDVCGG